MVNKKNTKNSENTGSVVDEPVQKKRGRPKGSTDKSDRKKRTDNNINSISPEIINRTNNFGMAIYNLPNIDVNDINQVNNRISEYFSICSQFDIKPTVASLALAFSISRITLFTWLTGKYHGCKNQECLNAIKKAYDYIGSLYETYLNIGSVNPVSCFFLMKNNYGYKDVTDYVVTNNQEQQLNLSDIANRAGLLSE